MKVALVGNQNSGKTTLFNTLTGLNSKVGNWPGVTIDMKSAYIKGTRNLLVDLPGIYSLRPFSSDEEVSRKFIFEEVPDVIINIIDSNTLERSLYLTMQLIELNIPMVVVLNMTDKLKNKGLVIDVKALEKELKVKVLEVSALKGTGVEQLLELVKISDVNNEKKRKLSYEEYKYIDELLISNRYNVIDNISKKVLRGSFIKNNFSDKLDKIFLNKWFAFPIFGIIMFVVYYLSVGIGGKYTTDLISAFFDWVKILMGNYLSKVGTSKWVISLIVNGIIAGVGAVINFVPQLVILFLCISLLEATGYMSRVAFLLDKIFRGIGLSGKSLIPFIIGSGCSVPGIMGSRIIENEDERKMTAILTPFIPCSAKLPIIAMFTSFFFEKNSGVISASLYLFAIMVIICSACVMKKYVCKNMSSTYISELPEYKVPCVKYVFKDVIEKVVSFLKRAGSVILICSIVLWFLLSFSFEFEYGVAIEESILATIGKKVSFVFYPMLGANSWAATVSAIQGVIAKEQVVSSMVVIARVADISGGANLIFQEEGIFGFFTASSAYAFMVFNLFSAPCIGAISAMKKELGSIKNMINAICFQTVLAWLLGTTVYQVGNLIECGIISIMDSIIICIVAIVVSCIIINGVGDECKSCPYGTTCRNEER